MWRLFIVIFPYCGFMSNVCTQLVVRFWSVTRHRASFTGAFSGRPIGGGAYRCFQGTLLGAFGRLGRPIGRPIGGL
jgi:hypothetical protein